MSAGPLTSPIWPLWLSIRKLFPVWGWISGVGTPGAWSAVGVDHVTGLRRNRSTQAVFDLLGGRTQAEVEAILALAELNARRQRQVLTAMIVAYVTIPLTAVATWAEISSDTVMNLLRDNAQTAINLLVIATLGVLYYAASHWRARQLHEVVELVRIERSAAPSAARAPAKTRRVAQ